MEKYWKLPPKIKIYEALGCIGDGRINVNGNSAKVMSSSGNKTYIVTYDNESNSIMANDNGSFWQGYLGYPSIAFLMAKGVVDCNKKMAKALAGIPWKDINTKFKNDFAKTENQVLEILSGKGFDKNEISVEINDIYLSLEKLKLGFYGKKTKPPLGY